MNVSMTLTCQSCGRKFVHEHEVKDKAGVESYKTWAQGHITKCRKCFAEEKAERVKKLEEKLGVPKITQGSDKQIAYAEKLRGDVLLAYEQDAGKIVTGEYDYRTVHHDKTLTALDTVLHGNNAGDIIDAAKKALD